MKPLPQKDYHELFRLSLIIKATDGFLEAIAGFLFYFVSYSSISTVAYSLLHSEIAEHPRDLFWGYLINQWHTFSLRTQAFWGTLFIVHGLTKAILSIFLLKKYIWAYPLSLAVFSALVLYEIYALIRQPSLVLAAFAIFDLIVIALISNEYKIVRRSKPVVR